MKDSVPLSHDQEFPRISLGPNPEFSLTYGSHKYRLRAEDSFSRDAIFLAIQAWHAKKYLSHSYLFQLTAFVPTDSKDLKSRCLEDFPVDETLEVAILLEQIRRLGLANQSLQMSLQKALKEGEEITNQYQESLKSFQAFVNEPQAATSDLRLQKQTDINVQLLESIRALGLEKDSLTDQLKTSDQELQEKEKARLLAETQFINSQLKMAHLKSSMENQELEALG